MVSDMMRDGSMDKLSGGDQAGFKTIEGDRLYIRATDGLDWAVFAEWETRPEVTEFFTMNEGRTLKDVIDEIEGRADDPTQLDLTICLREDGRILGRVYISNINKHYDSMDITRIYIGETGMRGHGLGREALRLVLRYGFDVLGLERITLDYMTGNEPAHQLYLEEGFKDEGCMRHSGKKNGRYVDLNLMSLLREEYYGLNK